MPDDPLPEIGSRAEARAAGLKRYFTGKPCRNGHLCERRALDAKCLECARAFDRKRYARCPRRGKRDPERARIMAHQWYWANRERALLYRLNKREADPEANRARALAWTRANPGRVLARVRQWRKDNPRLHNANNANRRAKVRKARPSWVDLKAIVAIYLACPPGMVVDHVAPLGGAKQLARTAEGDPISGLHVPWNLQYLSDSENAGKKHRMRAEDQALCEGTSYLFSSTCTSTE